MEPGPPSTSSPTGGPWRFNFYTLWTGQSISLLGDSVAYVALPLFVASLTGSALDLGLTSAAETLPTLLLGLLAGVFLDRSRLRPVLVVADLLRAAGFAALALLILGREVEIWMVFAVAFLTGASKVFFDTGLQAYLPSMVPDGYLPRANANLQISQSLSFPIGAALAGYLIATVGYASAFGFNGLTFVLSALSLLLLRGVPGRALSPERHFWPELVEGLSYLWEEARLRLMTLAGALANFVVAPIEVTLVLLAEQEMGLDASGIGLLFSVIGVGAVLGAVTAPRVIRRLDLGRTFVLGLIMLGGGFFLASFAGGFRSGAATTFVSFYGVAWMQVALITFRQKVTPPVLLGRVTAASRTIAWASLPAGAVLGGLAAERFGVVALFQTAPLSIVLAGLILMASPVWTARMPEVTSGS